MGTQGSNPGILQCRQTLDHLSPQGTQMGSYCGLVLRFPFLKRTVRKRIGYKLQRVVGKWG